MHPDLLRALEKERRAELLRPHHFRETPTDGQLGTPRRVRTPARRARRSIGIALVGVGTRLLRDGHAGIDLIDTRR
jgi:hypothetical protein